MPVPSCLPLMSCLPPSANSGSSHRSNLEDQSKDKLSVRAKIVYSRQSAIDGVGGASERRPPAGYARLARLVVEFLGGDRPADHAAGPPDAFHVVVPSLPGYGFSSRPTTAGWGRHADRGRVGRHDWVMTVRRSRR